MKSDIDAQVWHRVFMAEPRGVIVIIDPRVGDTYGQLRALPLLSELGLRNYTFTTSWHTFDFVPYDHLVVHENVQADALRDEFPVVQFIAQGTEDRSESDATKKLMMAQRASTRDPLLVYVLESEQFVLRHSTGAKGFVDGYELKRVYGYRQLFSRFCDVVGLRSDRIGAHYSLNIMLHRLGQELGDGEIVRRLADLFDFSRLPATSWAWNLLERLAARKSVRRDDRALARLLHPWIDGDISMVASRLLVALQRFDYDSARIQAHRKWLITQTGR